MALEDCRECGRQVSTEASTCPGCGVPDPTTNELAEVLSSIALAWWMTRDQRKTDREAAAQLEAQRRAEAAQRRLEMSPAWVQRAHARTQARADRLKDRAQKFQSWLRPGGEG